MIVRELITLFGFDLDSGDVRKVDTAVSRFEDRLRKVGTFIGGSLFLAGFARAADATVKFASDANETLNIIRESFGANAADVEAWSQQVAGHIGRSEFAMREMAGTLGALLNPLLDRNTEAAAEMATGLAELSVDLASFFNSSEPEALIALRSAISGETEPMKRFGVVLTEANLNAFALSQGIHKTFKSMSQAEKTTLRYQAIMHFTAAAQGDAARTSEDFANASRAAKDAVRDLATRIGQRLLPYARRFVVWARDATRELIDFSKHSRIIEVALISLGAAVAAFGVAMLIPFLPFLLTAAKVAAAVALIGLVVDEVTTFWKGGTTAIGEYIDHLFGVGTAQLVLDAHKEGLQLLVDEIWPELVASVEGYGHSWFEMIDGVKKKISEFLTFLEGVPLIGDFVKDARRDAQIAAAGAKKLEPLFAFTPLGAPLALLSDPRAAGDDAASRELRTRKYATRRGLGASTVSARRGSTSRTRRLERALELERKKAAEGLTKAEEVEFSRIIDVTPRTATAPARQAARPTKVEQRIEAPITISGAKDPAEVGREVRRQMDRVLEDAGAALGVGLQSLIVD